MEEALLKQAGRRVVGTKQVLRAVEEDRAARVFLGKDADGFIYHRLNALCEEKHVPSISHQVTLCLFPIYFRSAVSSLLSRCAQKSPF